MQHRLELAQLTDLVDYSSRTFGYDQHSWPWYYTTEGLDVYSMREQDLVTVTWTDRDSGLIFLLKHAADWRIQ